MPFLLLNVVKHVDKLRKKNSKILFFASTFC